MMLDETEPMEFFEILHFENLLKSYVHLGSQRDILRVMDIPPASKALCNSSFTIRFRNSEAPIYSASYRSAGPSDDKAAAKGLKDGKRFPESENKLGLSSPAQALTCPPEEAPPEHFLTRSPENSVFQMMTLESKQPFLD